LTNTAYARAHLMDSFNEDLHAADFDDKTVLPTGDQYVNQ